MPSDLTIAVHRRAGLRAVAGSLIVAAAIWVFAFKASSRMPDFEVYWTAGGRAARAEPLYRPEDGVYRLLYFPTFAVLAIPLGSLPLPGAKVVWFAASATALAALIWLGVQALPERRRPTWWLVLVAIVGLGKYYAEELVLGQANLMLAVVATGAIVALAARREALAGGLLALAVVVKPYGLIFLPWLVARRQIASTMAAAIGLLGGVAVVSGIYGVHGAIDLHRNWWWTVTDRTAGTLAHSDNVSVASMYTKWLGTGALADWLTATTSAILLFSAVSVFLARRGVARPDALEAALLLTLTPLLSPQGWDFVLLVSTPAIVYLANYHDRLPRVLRTLSVAAVAVLGLTLFDLLGRRLLYALLNASVLTLAVFVVIASLCALRFRRVA